MTRTPEIAAGFGLGAFICLAAGLALSGGPADAGYGVGPASRVVSNHAAKADMIAAPVKGKALEVAEIRRVGNDFILLDAKGRIVYRSDRQHRTTTVAKGAEIPLLTGYGVATSQAGN